MGIASTEALVLTAALAFLYKNFYLGIILEIY